MAEDLHQHFAQRTSFTNDAARRTRTHHALRMERHRKRDQQCNQEYNLGLWDRYGRRMGGHSRTFQQ
uniref:Uncharacterized protein n=1 Tax=Globisporangium ultimum (strain ATCC 200006 / CBS 805.95 / DAOM BR144) TaxID=431595 RepID=K3X2T3_GLOUD